MADKYTCHRFRFIVNLGRKANSNVWLGYLLRVYIVNSFFSAVPVVGLRSEGVLKSAIFIPFHTLARARYESGGARSTHVGNT